MCRWTPAYRWPLLEKAIGTPTWVKHENATPTGAFKVRGRTASMRAAFDAEHPVRGMIAATAATTASRWPTPDARTAYRSRSSSRGQQPGQERRD